MQAHPCNIRVTEVNWDFVMANTEYSDQLRKRNPLEHHFRWNMHFMAYYKYNLYEWEYHYFFKLMRLWLRYYTFVGLLLHTIGPKDICSPWNMNHGNKSHVASPAFTDLPVVCSVITLIRVLNTSSLPEMLWYLQWHGWSIRRCHPDEAFPVEASPFCKMFLV